MKLFTKRLRLSTFALTWLIVLSLSMGAFAHGIEVPSLPHAPWFSDDADVIPLTDDDMAQISGEVNPIVASAVSGAVYGAFEYATSPGEKTVSGFVKNTLLGAASGAILGTASTLAAATKVAQALESAGSVAWMVWGSANAGALTGSARHIIGN